MLLNPEKKFKLAAGFTACTEESLQLQLIFILLLENSQTAQIIKSGIIQGGPERMQQL